MPAVTGAGDARDPQPRAGEQSQTGDPVVKDWTPILALGTLAALAVMFTIGVLIGSRGSGQKVASGPQVLTVQGSGTSASAGGGSAQRISSSFDDWPAGKSAYTVQLQTVPRSGASAASVSAAKSAASSKGATAVGVLDGSKYVNLGQDFIIYSGIYPTQAKAAAALAKLKGSFSAAKVIHVAPKQAAAVGHVAGGTPVTAAQQRAGAATINQLSSCSGSQCSKIARKITQPIATPGKPPPSDHQAPGGGSGGGQTFR